MAFQAMSPEQVLKLNYTLKAALAGTVVGDANADSIIRTKFQQQFDAIKGNQMLMSQASNDDVARFYN